MTPPSNDEVIPNLTTGAGQPFANQSIPDQPVPWCSLEVIPNSTAELTNQSLNAA